MNGYALEFFHIRSDIPYPLHHLILVACLHHFIDFLSMNMPIIPLANFCQGALLIEMSKLSMHILYYLLPFTWFRQSKSLENPSLLVLIIIKRMQFLTMSNSFVAHLANNLPPFKIVRQLTSCQMSRL